MRGMTLLMATVAWAAAAVSAPAQEQLWIRQFGTSARAAGAGGLAPDGAGGVFVGGDTNGSLGGPIAGGLDAWLARYDGAGNRAWIVQFGTTDYDFAGRLAPDGAGGAFFAGSTSGSLGGPSAGEYDPWLARYDSAGNRMWIRQFGTSTYDYALALAPDGAGGVFIAGSTSGSLGGSFFGIEDPWLARYDSAGNRLWIRQFGTSAREQAFALAPDGAGGSFIAGYTWGNLGGPSAGAYDAWLARYDGAGNRHWILQFGTVAGDEANGLAPDGAAGVFIAGKTLGSLGGPHAGADDAWLARYDIDGNRLWIRQFGTAATEGAGALAPDGAAGVFIAGMTRGSLGGPHAGADDAWLARYDGAGNPVSILQIGTSANDGASALAPDGAAGVFIAGSTSGSLGGPLLGAQDAWIARYGPAACYPNCDTSTAPPILNVNDFICFQSRFAAADPYADCDHSSALNVNDFICFQGQFAAGCR